MRKVIFILTFSMLILFGTCKTGFMADVTCIDNGHWKCTVIENEQTTIVDRVIIYFHGSGNTGRNLRDLNNLMGKKAADGPTKYATTVQSDWITPGTVIVCPQAHNDKDFHENEDEVFHLINQQLSRYPNAKIILAGHSNGAIMLFKLAYKYGGDIVDGWAFISGKSPNGTTLNSTMTNVLVASGTGERYSKIGLARRADFDNLFYTKLGIEVTAWREEDTNNAYVVGDWTHGQTPRIFLERFFWEWIADI